MPIKILMPTLSPTMTEGNLALWVKNEGDKVSPGDVIAEIETDKATMELETVDEGVLAKILIPEGTEEIAVNTPIAIILEEGEDKSQLEDMNFNYEKSEAKTEITAAEEIISNQDLVSSKVSDQISDDDELNSDNTNPNVSSNDQGRIKSSPLARRMAEQQQIDLSLINGSGPNGRIVRADIEAFSSLDTPVVNSNRPQVYKDEHSDFEIVPINNIQKVVARRLTEAKQEVPHFYLTVDCEIDNLLNVREDLNSRAKNNEFKISINDMIIKACAVALMQVPAANASWSDEGIKIYKNANISVAVAINDGLITPILNNANRKGLLTISSEMNELVSQAHAGTLTPDQYQGGTFSISNLGMYGVKSFQAIINPPQGCIMAIGKVEKKPIVKNDEISIASIMSATLSVDHRVVDGAIGAKFMEAFKTLIEDPLGMLL
ncbi:MAG: pyruvate dehydrogenase complex dihydrolipoamide acetyltransferase [Rhodospirillales bacterium]|nr:pyruvate dehydrogenase complex dihydrolipoamide acetyltransferase [Rhodospirillales bacterium]